MAASLAYCQAVWKDDEPSVIKDGWRPILRLDIIEGNVLLHWHNGKSLPLLILCDSSDAEMLDKQPPPEYKYLLRVTKAKDAAFAHLIRDLHALGSNFKVMLVVHVFGRNATKVLEDHNVGLAFDYAQTQAEPLFSRELADWARRPEYNESTQRCTKFAGALEFARELIPVVDAKIAEL
jgi:hypothetical protein